MSGNEVHPVTYTGPTRWDTKRRDKTGQMGTPLLMWTRYSGKKATLPSGTLCMFLFVPDGLHVPYLTTEGMMQFPPRGFGKMQ